MPSVSEKQRRFMGAELARSRSGKRTRTGMSEDQLREFAKKAKHAVGGAPGSRRRELGRRLATAAYSRSKSAGPAARSVAAAKSARARRK